MAKESYVYCKEEIAEAIKLAPDLSKLKITLPRGLSEQEQLLIDLDNYCVGLVVSQVFGGADLQ